MTIARIGKQYFNLDNIESYEFVNNNKSIILHTVSGRAFLYDVEDVPGLIKYLKDFFEDII